MKLMMMIIIIDTIIYFLRSFGKGMYSSLLPGELRDLQVVANLLILSSSSLLEIKSRGFG